MSFRLAAYAVCIEDGRVLLARHVSPEARHVFPEGPTCVPGGPSCVTGGQEHLDASGRQGRARGGPVRRGDPGGRRGDRMRRGGGATAGSGLAGGPRGYRACRGRAPECRDLLPGPYHRRRAAARAGRCGQGTDACPGARRREKGPDWTGETSRGRKGWRAEGGRLAAKGTMGLQPNDLPHGLWVRPGDTVPSAATPSRTVSPTRMFRADPPGSSELGHSAADAIFLPSLSPLPSRLCPLPRKRGCDGSARRAAWRDG